MPAKSHGDSNGKARLYYTWQNMLRRCRDSFNKAYKYYGGRGIKVCDEWGDYKIFKIWALSNGYKDNLEIDRIDNNNGYYPQNCRWVIAEVNRKNKTTTIKISAFGESKLATEWVKDFRCKTTYFSLLRRVQRGWEVEKALSTPLIFTRK